MKRTVLIPTFWFVLSVCAAWLGGPAPQVGDDLSKREQGDRSLRALEYALLLDGIVTGRGPALDRAKEIYRADPRRLLVPLFTVASQKGAPERIQTIREFLEVHARVLEGSVGAGEKLIAEALKLHPECAVAKNAQAILSVRKPQL